jgi:Acyl-CoA oxidase
MSPQEAVQIMDAFQFSDYELGSVLGRYDGKVYETLWEEVRKDPVNSEKLLREPVLEMIQGKWKKGSKL